jgi:PAS domain S-box-containing protein
MSSEHLNPLSPFAVVVNDDLTQLNVLSGLVRKAGLEPRDFTGAEAALADMSARAAGTAVGKLGAFPALVVTDLYMPGIDGWRFCRLLRSPEYVAFNHIPILVVSATFAGDESNRIADDLGAEAFLPSPVDGRRFVEQVRAILSGNRVRTPLRVLVVEDSQTLAGIIKKAFVAHGYQADTALTARAASDAFAMTAYDVAVLDYHLPDGMGDALLDAFRVQRPDCVCLMMTTDTGPELALDWMKRGAAAYLKKPFQPDYLIELSVRARRERALLRVQDLIEVRTCELRESEKQYRGLFTGSRDGIVVVDCQGKFLDANAAYCAMIGYSVDELQALSGFSCITPEKWQVWEHDEIWNRRLMKDGHSGIYEKEFIRKDGTIFPVELQSFTVFDSSGKPKYLWGTARDITAIKQAESEQEKLQAQLNQAQKMESVGRLAGGVAHDFNNMLGVILGYAELALGQVDPNQRIFANLQQIRKAAQRSADLTLQLLAFARKQTVAPRVLDLNETVEGMLNMLRRLIGEDINLAWFPDKNIWPVKVDPSQIDQNLANLCVNARDAIVDVGRITIETGNIAFDADYCANHAGFAPGEYVMLAVSDDGYGMDKETLTHIFEPFFTTKVVGRGTGLGLATVYGAVKQNNGFINVYSEPNHGTTFRIYLPRHKGEAGQTQKESPAAPAAQGHKTILLAEDEPAILELATIMLEQLGYTVLAASLPSEAIRLAETYPDQIHLLMTDVVMPEMNGRGLAKNLLSIYPSLKCLFMSGYTANVIAHHGVLDEGVYFIQKPFSMDELATKVRKALGE